MAKKDNMRQKCFEVIHNYMLLSIVDDSDFRSKADELKRYIDYLVKALSKEDMA